MKQVGKTLVRIKDRNGRDASLSVSMSETSDDIHIAIQSNMGALTLRMDAMEAYELGKSLMESVRKIHGRI